MASSETIREECERRGIPVRFDGIVTAGGLAALLDVSPDTVRKWRERGGGPAYRIAPWKGCRYTYSLTSVADWLEIAANRTERA